MKQVNEMKQSAESHKQRAELHQQREKPSKRRSGWKVFLTPGWIVIAILVLMFTYFAFTFLAPWQLGKGERKSETNHRLQAAMEHDPVPVGEVLPAQGPAPDEKEWTHVSLQGHFEPAKQVLLHNRPVDSSPAFQVLTPFKTADGVTVLVNRGWLPPAEGSKVPEIPAPPSGQRTVTGFVRLGEASASEVVNSGGVPQTQAINSETIGRSQGIELAHDYVQLDVESLKGLNEGGGGNPVGEQPANGNAGGESALRPIPLPQLDNGPHLSYGIQWIAFGILAPIGLAWAIRNELRERKLEEKDRELGDSAPSARMGTALPDKAQNGENLGNDGRCVDAQDSETRVQLPGKNGTENSASESAGKGSLEEIGTSAPHQSAADESNASERLLADRYGRQRTHLGGGNGMGGFGRRSRRSGKEQGRERF